MEQKQGRPCRASQGPRWILEAEKQEVAPRCYKAVPDKDRDGGVRDNAAGWHAASEETGDRGLLRLPKALQNIE